MPKQSPHLRKKGTATQLIVDKQPLILLSGELHNSSASSLAYMEPIWPRMKALGLNALIVPLYWELVEPEEGRFDLALVDGLIAQAVRHEMRIVFLWFATWKNGVSSYVPGWVKADVKRFPRMDFKPGKRSTTLSPFGAETRDRDSGAFAAVMKRIREIDSEHHSVVAMQVENEVGFLGAARDWSPVAQKQFEAQVPEPLMAYLTANQQALLPETIEAWGRQGSRTAGSWEQVFGEDAPEIFMAWHIGSYIGHVVATGKREYAIPMYVNAWLKQKDMGLPGQYPAGGPVSRMMDIWRATAPAIDFYAPDIYVPYFKEVCASYHRSGNPLFIPEAWNDERAAGAVFHAIGNHDAICFAPFAIDDVQPEHPLAQSYRLLTQMMPLLTRYNGTGRMAGFYQEANDERVKLTLGGYDVHVGMFKKIQTGTVAGGGLIIALEEEDEFIIVGRNLWIEFRTIAAPKIDLEFLWLEQGTFANGEWKSLRRLNGDETGHGLGAVSRDELAVLRLKLNRHSAPVYSSSVL